MVAQTRGESGGKELMSHKERPPDKSLNVIHTEQSDSSTDSDTSSDGEMTNIVSVALKEFSATSCDVDSESSDEGSDEGDSDTESSPGDSLCFVLDKNPGPKLMSFVEDTLGESRPSTSKQSPGDNGGRSGQSAGTCPTDSCPTDTCPADKESGNTGRETTSTNRYELITTLDPGIDMSDIYVDVDAYEAPQPSQKISELHAGSQGDLLKGSVVDGEFEKKHTVPPYEQSVNQLKKQRRAERAKTNGRGWFDMPIQEMTDAKKNDLMVLQMRRVLDPKRFYKAPDTRAIPKFFQMGRIVEGPADFYHGRIPKKQRKATLVDELLADAEFRKYNKRKYAELVEQKKVTSGAFKHMKRLKKRKK